MSDVISYPGSWEEKELSEITSYITDGAHFSPVPQEYGEIIVNVKDLTDNDIMYEGCTRILKKDFDFLVRQNCSPKRGDILLSKDGTIGKVVLFESANRIVLLSSVAIIRLVSEVWPAFVKHVLKSFIFDKQLYSLQSGSALKRIVLSDIRQLKVTLPDYSAQQKIAKILTAVDNLIEKTQALIDKYTAIKQGMMADLFTRGIDLAIHIEGPDGTLIENPNYGQLHPSYEDAPELYKAAELGRVPKEWKVMKLGEICHKITDGSHQAVQTTDDGGVPFLFVSSIRDGQILWDKTARITDRDYAIISKGREPKKGDVLYTAVGSYGHAASVDEDADFTFQRHIAYMKPNSSYLNSTYLTELLNFELMKRWADKVALGNAQKTVTLGTLANYPILLPSIEEQDAFMTTVTSVNRSIAIEKISLGKYKETKKGLMQDLLTGKVKVN